MAVVFHIHPNHAEVDALEAIGNILDDLDLIEAVSVIAVWFAAALAAVGKQDDKLPLYWLGAFQVALAEARVEVAAIRDEEGV